MKLIAIVSLIVTPGYSASPPTQTAKHPIDAYQQSCIAADPTTAGMTNCTNQARGLWEKEMEIKYMNLLSVLKPEEKKVLQHSQRQWMAYRDAEFKAIDTLYNRLDGTMYIPMRASEKLSIVKNRVQCLVSYFSLIEQ